MRADSGLLSCRQGLCLSDGLVCQAWSLDFSRARTDVAAIRVGGSALALAALAEHTHSYARRSGIGRMYRTGVSRALAANT